MTDCTEEDVKTDPQLIRDDLWMFSANSDVVARSWWLGCNPEPVLIDCPPLTKANIEALKVLAGGRSARIILTSRRAHGRVSELQETFGWPVVVQEQEKYLLPNMHTLETFADSYRTFSDVRVLWTPGPTPGSCVVYAPSPWNVLFCGLLLIPVAFDQIASIQNRMTFHWPRQQESVKKLLAWLPPEARPSLASGGSPQMFSSKSLFKWEAWKSSHFA